MYIIHCFDIIGTIIVFFPPIFVFIYQKDTLRQLNQENGKGQVSVARVRRLRTKCWEAVRVSSRQRRTNRRLDRNNRRDSSNRRVPLPRSLVVRGGRRKLTVVGYGIWGIHLPYRQWFKHHYPAGVKVHYFLFFDHFFTSVLHSFFLLLLLLFWIINCRMP